MTELPAYVLATDLDGTFLGGTDLDRAQLYQRFRGSRREGVLAFVTGRDLGFIKAIVEAGLVPRPDYVIGDVGTTVVDGSFKPVAAVQDAIDEVWQGRSAEVIALLQDIPGLRLQPGDWHSRRRVSYYYEPSTWRPEALARVEAAGFDGLRSADLYFDVLPKGVSKGPTLRRLVEHLGWPEDRVLAAGDTLNDRSLLVEGFQAVAVGNSEPALLAAVERQPRVYRAARPGAGGILEALHHTGLLESR